MLACLTLALFYAGLLSREGRLILAFGLGAMILGLAFLEREKNIAWPGLLLALGNASYSIYLVHNPLLSITQRVAGRMEMNWSLGMVCGVAVSAGCGYLYFGWVERRALQAVRRWWCEVGAGTVSAPSSAGRG